MTPCVDYAPDQLARSQGRMPIESLEVIARRLRHADLAAALAIQSQSYLAFLFEDKAAFASRLDITATYWLATARGGRGGNLARRPAGRYTTLPSTEARRT